jgi:hypothetical protein
MSFRFGTLASGFMLSFTLCAQLPVARDTITVFESGRVLKYAWAGGLNSVNVSNADLNGDQKMDLVVFDKQNTYGFGRFRCFLKTGQPGQISFRSDPGLSYYFPEAVFWAVLQDYNNDGKADLFCSTNGGIKVYRNTTQPQGVPSFSLASLRLSSDYYPDLSPPSISNLYASSAGVPGIADVDNDGDLDILTFSPLGVFLELHTNMSQELYGNSDSLVYQRDDDCWGDLSESSCEVNFEICSSKLSGPANTYHAGSCIACLDSDGDHDQDLIMGDQTCSFVHYVHNTGTDTAADFTDSTRLYPNFPAKNSNNTFISMSFFPCAYMADVDDDGKKDLLASPNAIGSENFNSLWLYRDAATTATANFQLQKKNFLQDEMIDVGQNSYPVFFDENSDGKKDLLIGTQGYYAPGALDARLALYRNIGTKSAPVFSLITRDYANLGVAKLNNVMPAVGDPDNDGDVDILIGTSPGQVHWLENTAGAGNPCQYSALKINPFSFTTQSSSAAPQLFDIDKDGKQDLLIGMKNGRIAYYKNTTSGSTVTFSLITSFLGSVDVKSDPGRYGLEGYAVPYFYIEGGVTYLLVGTVTGDVRQYSVSSASSDFVELTGRVNGLTEGSQATPLYEDINGDNKRDYIVGMATGGLSFFSSASPYVGIEENSKNEATTIIVFPNPASTKIGIVAENIFSSCDLSIRDITGRILHTEKWIQGSEIDVSELAEGVYFIELQNQFRSTRGKFLKR